MEVTLAWKLLPNRGAEEDMEFGTRNRSLGPERWEGTENQEHIGKEVISMNFPNSHESMLLLLVSLTGQDQTRPLLAMEPLASEAQTLYKAVVTVQIPSREN